MANHGEGELEFSAKTKLQMRRGTVSPPGAKSVEISPCVTLISSGINGREQTLENGDMKVPFNLQNGCLTDQGKLWRRQQVSDSMSMDC